MSASKEELKEFQAYMDRQKPIWELMDKLKQESKGKPFDLKNWTVLFVVIRDALDLLTQALELHWESAIPRDA